MNPHSNEAPGIELSPSVAEPLSAPNGAESATQPAEMAPAASERSPSVQAASSGAASAIPLPAPPILPAAVPQATTPATAGLPQVDDDGDLIEKEWVNKAKHIVETTRDDPHKQSEELTVVKADYMKKRYGKTIKLSQ
ncbi:MAG: hypothetical protein AAB436_00385 [Patescibacteria group bacterium]